ncbi:MAG: transglutaminase domain-containing protein [Fibrobacter sp.]|nr:transglutaminase domain-containing protein [Fibrobacter sp.]
MNDFEIVDVRYVTKVIFLCLTSYLFANTCNIPLLGIVLALYFLVLGCLNATRRRKFSQRPRYRKWIAYLVMVPLIFYWIVTPGGKVGVNPLMVYLPGFYFLMLTALQERSRGNGGYESFVNFNSMAALLAGTFHAPRGIFIFFAVALALYLFSNSRRGTAWYKYLIFLVLFASLWCFSYGGFHLWRSHHRGGGFSGDTPYKNQVVGFNAVHGLGSLASNLKSRRVVLRVWDPSPPQYMVGARYASYAGGVWKLPKGPTRILTPAYYQVDYAVMELSDSVTRDARRVWVQSTFDDFGFLFSPAGAVGFSVKDVDSLQYFAGGMVTGINQNGKRSDWYYFVCSKDPCERENNFQDTLDLEVLPNYENFLDSVIEAMELRVEESQIKDDASGIGVLKKMRDYFSKNFEYSLQVPELEPQNLKNREDPIRVFWRVRRGFCAYYATLSALVLRRLGYPARYVSGFAGPEVKEGRPYGIYRQKDSHAWVEVFMHNQWVRFDPTPAAIGLESQDPSLFENLWEKIQGRFSKWTHELKEGGWRTSLDRWQAVFEEIFESPKTYVVLTLVVGGFIARRMIVLRRRKSKTISPGSLRARELAKKLASAERQLSRVGLERGPGETVGRFLLRIQDAPLEGRADNARKFLQEYENTRWRI